MKQRRSIVDHYYRMRSRIWRWRRLLFPSPAEVRFLRLMGARMLYIKWLKSKPNNFCFTYVLSYGKILRHAKMHREVRYGRFYVDFANDIHWLIEIDGAQYHQDVVADFDREVAIREMLQRAGHQPRFLHIPAPRLWHDQVRVKRDVIKFLST